MNFETLKGMIGMLREETGRKVSNDSADARSSRSEAPKAGRLEAF
jgi:hypothetical protein